MAEANSLAPVPFVTRLRSLCQHIDKNMALLKLDLARPPGSTPFTYDRGLNVIKNEICDLKKKCEEMKPAMESIQNFSNWLHSMQELVNQQSEDVKKMEEYLIKFGYNPVQNPPSEIPITSASEVEVIGKSSVSDSRTTEKALQNPPNNKPVVVTSSQNNKQAKTPLVPPAAAKLTKDVADSVEYQKTPLSSRNKLTNSLKTGAGRGSCYRYGHSTTVEQWLQGIENCMLELTPDVLRGKRVPAKEKQEQRDRIKEVSGKIELPDLQTESEIPKEVTALSKVPVTPAQNHLSIPNVESHHNTPAEPELSEYTTQFLNFNSFLARKGNETPHAKQLFDRNTRAPKISTTLVEDPPLTCNSENKLNPKEEYSQGKTAPLHEEKSYSNLMINSTPEESVLSYQASAMSANHIETKTPEEPVLSNMAAEYSNSDQMETRTLKDPVLSYQLPKCSATSEVDTKTPEEPVLSYQNIKPVTTSEIDSKTPEEPVLSYQLATNNSVETVVPTSSTGVQNHLCCDDMPPSPQFSDITQSLLSVTNQIYTKNTSLNTEKSILTYPYGQDSRTFCRNDKQLFGRGGREISNRTQPSQLFSKASQENISPLAVDSQEDKKKWHHPGITFERFLGGDDDIPPSPQLSETTQRLFTRLY